MPQIPPSVAETSWHRILLENGFCRIHQGKVRDTYDVHGSRLQVATDRVSIFDFVLPALVVQKGEVLTAMTIFWLTQHLKGIQDHLHLFGRLPLSCLPLDALEGMELWKRAMIVEPLLMVPFECIVRGYLTGSGWDAYQESGEVCGHKLPAGLFNGSRLPEPTFTPTTKATVGHDEHVKADSVAPVLGEVSLKVFAEASTYAQTRGLILVDTKFEFGYRSEDSSRFHPASADLDDPVLGDEVLTPDSSRYWDAGEYAVAVQERKLPNSFDKQFVREWGAGVQTPWGKGIGKLEPKNPEHVAFVHGLSVPEDVLVETSRRNHLLFERLVGSTLVDFQDAIMR